MCVIIDRKPGTTVPFEMLQSACIVNPDGFGVVAADRGKLVTWRGYNPKGNDPENVAKILEETKDLPTVLHLRYATKGTKDVENCHPFEVLNKKDHGIDVMFAHNGTLYDFNDTKVCDSKLFVHKVLTPIMERSCAWLSPEELLKDEVLIRIMEKYAGTSSKFTLIDSSGQVAIVNRKEGKNYDFGWASNEYSFNEYHRTGVSSKSTSGGYYYSNGTHQASGSGTRQAASTSTAKAGNNSVVSVPWRGGTATETKEEAALSDALAQVKEFLANADEQDMTRVVTITPPEKRKNFVTETGLKSLEDILVWEPDDFLELCQMFPEAATLLFMDLQYELFMRKQARDVSH